MSCAYLADLSQTIWLDLGQPSGQPPSYIQSRLVSQPYIGNLNNLLATCYVSVSGDIMPELGNTEQGIYSKLYQYDYYGTQLNRTLQGINPGIVSLQDGDSRIVFSNPVEVARIYRDARNTAYDEMVTLVGAWRQDKSQPNSVDMPLIVNGLGGEWGGGYGGAGPNPRNYYRG